MKNLPAVEDGVNVKSLEDWQDDAFYLKESIVAWLDAEYIPQDCHFRIASKVEQTYLLVWAVFLRSFLFFKDVTLITYCLKYLLSTCCSVLMYKISFSLSKCTTSL